MKLAAIKPVSRVLARELGITALLLFGVSMVVFAILYLAPGDPLNVLLEGQSPRSELALGMREALGVSQTWYGQYAAWFGKMLQRSEEHTSELQSHHDLVCRLLPE